MGAIIVMVIKLIISTVVSSLTREEIKNITDHIHKLHPKAKDAEKTTSTSEQVGSATSATGSSTDSEAKLWKPPSRLS